MTLEYRKHISRASMQEEPNTLFVFGDNLHRRGRGGQAREMRGEPNAVGIPTKRAPSNRSDAFFSDEDFDEAKKEIDAAFDKLIDHLNSGGRVVWPEDGIGTGLADLQNRAPKIWGYLEQRRQSIAAVAEKKSADL